VGDESRLDTELGGEGVEGPDGAVIEAVVVVGGEERGEGGLTRRKTVREWSGILAAE
jgi:hypothetical protein